MPGFMTNLVMGSEEITDAHGEKSGEGGLRVWMETQQPGSSALVLLLEKEEVQVTTTHALKTSSTPQRENVAL